MSEQATMPVPPVGAPRPDAGPLTDIHLQHEVEQFLTFEARLLDERRFREWLGLMADDVTYRMPIRRNRTMREQHLERSGMGDVANFDDTRRTLEIKIRRIETGVAWTEDPPSRTRHLVTNVWIRPTADETEIEVDSSFLVYRNRNENEVDVWVGSREDLLRRRPDGLLEIARRTIVLDQSVVLSNNLAVFF